MFFEPRIPQNTGSAIRLSAVTGAELHLVEPLGFDLSEPKLRRAGLDYHEWATVRQHDSLADCLASLNQPRVFALSTRGTRPHSNPVFEVGDAFLLGSESCGLPAELLASLPEDRILRIPMRTTAVESARLQLTAAQFLLDN